MSTNNAHRHLKRTENVEMTKVRKIVTNSCLFLQVMLRMVINFPTSLDYCDAFCKYLMTSYPRENKSVTKCQFRHEEDLELVNLLHLSWYYEAVVHTARALLIAVWLKFPSFPLTLREMGQKKINAFAIDFLAKRLFSLQRALREWKMSLMVLRA